MPISESWSAVWVSTKQNSNHGFLDHFSFEYWLRQLKEYDECFLHVACGTRSIILILNVLLPFGLLYFLFVLQVAPKAWSVIQISGTFSMVTPVSSLEWPINEIKLGLRYNAFNF